MSGEYFCPYICRVNKHKHLSQMNTTNTMRDYRTGGVYTYLSMTERDITIAGVPVVATLEATANFGGINYGSFRWTDGMVTIDALSDMIEAFRAFDHETHGRILDTLPATNPTL